MYKTCLFFILNILICHFSFAQFSLLGIVVQKSNQETIEAANIFLANTTLGTISDKDGNFQLNDIPFGQYEVIVSHLGYKTIIKNIDFQVEGDYVLEVELEVMAFDLEEVNVVSLKEKKRKRFVNRFSKAFLGVSRNANKCSLLNPEVLDFVDKGNGDFSATARDLLQIENRGTGYQLTFYLEKFDLEKGTVSYGGKPFFKTLIPKSEKEAKKWMKARKTTYQGSSRHFYKALLTEETRSEGFEIYHAILENNSTFKSLGKAQPKKVFIPNDAGGQLEFKEFLKIVYTKEKDNLSAHSGGLGNAVTGLGRPAEKDIIEQEKGDFGHISKDQTSYIYMLKDAIHLNENGQFARPEWVKEYGYWALEGVADLLPWEYSQTDNKLALSILKKDKKCPPQNGFDLSNLSISCDEIQSGGPPKDGIPAINKPKFQTANQVQFLQPDDYILGVKVNGVIKAYPIRIMNHHEVVNDDFGGLSIAVTYCPLCGSGLAFEATVNGQKKTFGVSGLLYNSDVLLYDRATESLWSQIMMTAISGEEKGSNLELIPTIFTTWENWKNKHPQTLVLTEQTGFNKNYNINPYERYEASPDLLFKVKEKNNKFRKKEKVIGIEVGGQYMAYPFSFFKKIDMPYQSTFNGKTFLIYFDKKNKTAWMTDLEGNEVSAMTMYWFAWYAFHPQTEVAKRN